MPPTFWQDRCQRVPAAAMYITVDIGGRDGVRDIFRPQAGASWCEMLGADNRHMYHPGVSIIANNASRLIADSHVHCSTHPNGVLTSCNGGNSYDVTLDNVFTDSTVDMWERQVGLTVRFTRRLFSTCWSPVFLIHFPPPTPPHPTSRETLT